MMKRILHIQLPLFLLASLVWISSCKDKDPLEAIAGFKYTVDATDFKKVTFTNASENFVSLTWDFGDGSTSTEQNPVHTYAALGTYTVKLTAKGEGGDSNTQSQTVTISDPNAELTKLVGSTSKTWKLLRVVSGNRWPLEVGPLPYSTVWWAMGRDNDEIAKRPCIMNDEWIFSRDGKMEYKTNGDFWAEGGVFSPANDCLDATAANMKNAAGDDLTAFGNGVHKFTLTNGTTPTLEVIGKGAFIGLCKIGTDRENKLPQPSVKLNILKLSDGTTDTLILESKWKFENNTSGTPDAYWRVVLVHYDNAADEPAIPKPKPVAGFSNTINGLTVSFTNTSTLADSYSWDFGDGMKSSEASPSHTYAAAGIYKVVLTATNANGSSTATTEVTLSSGFIKESELVGRAWKVRVAANSVFVGPGLGNAEWWQVPVAGLNGGATGAEDWSCMTDDEFIFTAGGKYEYKTNGTARNDGYMGSPNGCWSDAQVAASGNGAAFGSGVHSFTFTSADKSPSGRPLITLTNGAKGAAFLGFYKGYYGGENTDSAKAPNGGSTTNQYEVMNYLKTATQETLTISVDISEKHDGTKAWSVVLVR